MKSSKLKNGGQGGRKMLTIAGGIIMGFFGILLFVAHIETVIAIVKWTIIVGVVLTVVFVIVGIVLIAMS